MNSFIGISQLRTTNLAVVAPGIAEALLATAFGLAAAIPAVVIYNAFARSIAHYRALYADASVEILTLVSRDLSQQPGSREPRVSDSRRSLAAAPAAE
jgi:biopolymer transport protein ExbB